MIGHPQSKAGRNRWGRRACRALFLIVLLPLAALGTDSPRREWPLLDGWRTAMDEQDRAKFDGFEHPAFDDSVWRPVAVPHNWETYEGVRRLVHGNLHGYAWYRRTFDLPASEAGRRVFLFFEGVGSYATVWVNGLLAGTHAGGRVTFTLDVTDLVRVGQSNTLAVRADHPVGITDLPWVCGGCSPNQGFSEGSQPLGVFRPVTLVTTNDLRVAPFGIHVWNDADTSAERAQLHFTTEIDNLGAARDVTVYHSIRDPQGLPIAGFRSNHSIVPGLTTLRGEHAVSHPTLWSPAHPHLYTLVTTLLVGDRVVDEVETPFGLRTSLWPDPAAPEPAPFRLNGEPLFLNGTCEYEHRLGASHAFGPEEIAARARQMKAAGFNAFRDAHQPHNLRYQEHWDREGLLWWTQMAAQIWFDNPEFRANFKRLLRQWVRERRNSPSLVLWGLANESKLPEDFARECTDIIRELDPTSPSQRLVTTCNGGTGTDWNVPQNWTGTYGGDPATYADDLLRQRLIGEYGAWRSLGLHSEGGFVMDGIRSESRADALFAQKIRLAESVRDRVPGHFHWLFLTHENPGRALGSRGQQGSDGWDPLDRIGPANNKGLHTLWGEPTDALFLYRASYAPKSDPMIHIVSHTWSDRWDGPGVKSGLLVWSNCDEVELFNGAGSRSLGVRRNGGPGVPFRWDEVEIATNVLYAEGRIAGRTVARDALYLLNLPDAPDRAMLRGTERVSTAAEPGWNYLYRVNAGGPRLVDSHGQIWLADRDLRDGRSWGSRSWAMRYPELPPRFGSQRHLYEPVRGTADEALFHTYRYGRDQLAYEFALPDGDYRLELYFAEPWFGRGGGDATAWRLFDVAVNGETLLRGVDLFREAGYMGAVKRVVSARARNGRLLVSFPHVAAAQAVLAGVAIASRDFSLQPPTDAALADANTSRTEVTAATGPSASAQLYPATQASRDGSALTWKISLGLGGSHDFILRYTHTCAPAEAEFRINAADGTAMDLRTLRLHPTADGAVGEQRIDGVGMNAGDYTVTLVTASPTLRLEALLVD